MKGEEVGCICWQQKKLCEKCRKRNNDCIDHIISILQEWRSNDNLAISAIESVSGTEDTQEGGQMIKKWDGTNEIVISTKLFEH